MDLRNSAPFIGMPLLLIAVQIGALLLTPQMQSAGISAFEDPASFGNTLIFIGILLGFTLILLLLIRWGGKRIIAAVIAASIFFTFIYIFSALTMFVFGGSLIGTIATFLLAVCATGVLYLYPEWYVIDTLGVLIAAGVAAIFGISLEIAPVLILLVLLAVYDAISVYKTRHMIELAENVVEMKAPILVVIPKSRNYSYIKEGLSLEKGERGAFIMGMGDLIMPSILVVSVHAFLDAPLILGLLSLPTVGTMLGSLAGLAVLLYYVNRGNPQAGLPTLNGGAIAGFLIVCLLTGSWGWIPGI
ncbi:MAG: hypothetical protein JXA08_06150 [Methanomicrobiaceae archaeon]|nr:hypothetical protein [Methanomicrobiaceae archaeon]